MFKPSEKQQLVFDTIVNTDKNILIQAIPGSGKTTTLIQSLNYFNKYYTKKFITFNKSISVEINEKLAKLNYPNAEAMTLHSLGLKAINEYSYNKIKIDKNKGYKICNELEKINSDFKKLHYKKKRIVSRNLIKLYDNGRLYLLNSSNDLDSLIEKTMLSESIITETMNFIHDYFSIARRMNDIFTDNSNINTIVIDFIDMIYFPVKFNLNIPLNADVLLLDEAQDFSLLQHKFIGNLLPKVKRFIVVGDENQSIYGFGGADSDSFSKFRNYPNVTELSLDLNYRSKPAIVEEFNKIYNVGTAYRNDTDAIVDVITDPREIKEPSLVICRNKAPLVKVFIKLLEFNKKAYISSKDIFNMLKAFLNKYDDTTYLDVVVSDINSELVNIMRTHPDKLTKKQMIQEYVLKENLGIIQAINDSNSDINTIRKLFKYIDLVNNNKKNAIELSTIHSTKGRECEIVYLLNESLMPVKFAKTKEELKQEQNLRFVARSRAMNEFYYLNLNTDD